MQVFSVEKLYKTQLSSAKVREGAESGSKDHIGTEKVRLHVSDSDRTTVTPCSEKNGIS